MHFPTSLHSGSHLAVAVLGLWTMVGSCLTSVGESYFHPDPSGNLVQVDSAVPVGRPALSPGRQVVSMGRTARIDVWWSWQPGDRGQWFVDDRPIADEASSSLFVPVHGIEAEGRYRFRIWRSGALVESQETTIWYDSDGDGLGDSWEQQEFGSLVWQGHEDSDRDGLTQLEEFEDGTDPTDPSSGYARLTVDALNGWVASTPDSVTGRYPRGTVVTLTARALEGWAFDAWTGDLTSFQPEIRLTMSAHRTLRAGFVRLHGLSQATGGAETALTWRTGGAVAWRGEGGSGLPEGPSVARVHGLGHGQETWLETDVEGPGVLSWWWRVSSDPGDSRRTGDPLRCEIDGEPVTSIAGEIPWQPVTLTLGPGRHRARWTYAKDATVDAGVDGAWLDRVRVESVAAGSLADGMDLPSALPVVASGAGLWARTSETTHDGEDALVSPAIEDDMEAWVETVVVGPGTLQWWWKVSSDVGTRVGDGLELWVDGAPTARLAGERDWTPGELYLDGREHRIRWRYAKDFTGTSGADRGWLDRVTFAPSPSLGVALDEPALTYTSDGDAPWAAEGGAASSRDGVDFVRSGPVSDGKASWLETTVTGPGSLTFDWNVVSESAGDLLTLWVDGRRRTGISGTPGWAEGIQTVPAGSHVLRWIYAKDAAGVLGADRGMLDRFRWRTGASFLEESLDAPTLAWTGTGSPGWTSQSETTHDGRDAVVSGPLPSTGAGGRLATVVTGPGTVSFWWKSSMANAGSVAQGFRFLVDGRVVDRIVGERDWTQAVWLVPAGPVLLEWDVVRPSASAGANAAWLDEVGFVAGGTPTLAESIGGTGLTWSTGGDAAWTGIRTTLALDGGSLAVSPSFVSPGESWLEANLNGPGRLRFSWAVSSEEDEDELTYAVDGQVIVTRSGEVPWETLGSDLPPGPHRVRWSYRKNAAVDGGLDMAWVDAVTFETDPEPIGVGFLREGVEAPWLGLHTGSAAWSRRTEVSHDGQDALRSAAVPHGGRSSLVCDVLGPGILSFWWKVSSASGDALGFYQDGSAAVPAISGAVDWRRVEHAVPAGRHLLLWQYAKNGSGVGGEDAGWLDEIAFVPTTDPELANAVELPADIPIATGGTAGVPAWTRRSGVSHDGLDAARSPALTHRQNAFFQTTVEGPGTLSFWYSVSSLAGDNLEFYLDGTSGDALRLRRGGTVPWTRFETSLDEGPHLLTWNYAKDSSGSAGDDAAWIDAVAVLPPVGLEKAAESVVPLTTGGSSPWRGEASVDGSRDGVDRLVSGALPVGGESWLEATVTGPVQAWFFWAIQGSGNDDRLGWWVDGVEVASLEAAGSWSSVSRSLGPGEHRVRWVFRRGGGSGVPGRGVLDRVNFLTADAPALANALDLPDDVPVQSVGPAVWARQVSFSSDGVDAAQSVTLEDGRSSSLEFPATGPGTLAFRWKVSSQLGGDRLSFWVDGEEAATALSGDVDWKEARHFLAPGAHMVRWVYAKNASGQSGMDSGFVDQVSVQPAVSLPTALEAPGTIWETGGTAPWVGYVDGAEDWAGSGGWGGVGETWLTTRLTGPGTLTFLWTLAGGRDDLLEFSIDGETRHSLKGNQTRWWTQGHVLTPGLHDVRWRYERVNSSAGPAAWGRLDAVAFVPEAVPSLAAGSEIGWESVGTGGHAGWVLDTTTTHDGVDALRSGTLAHGESSSLATWVDGPGTLTFWWRIASERGADVLRFQVDGTSPVSAISGKTNWEPVTLYLAAGRRRLDWTYFENTVRTAGSDAGWVDSVSFVPDTNPSLAESLDAPDQVWTTGPQAYPWRGVGTSEAHDGVNAARLGDVASEGGSWLETTVPGGRTVRFWWRTDPGRQIRFYVDGVLQSAGSKDRPAWTEHVVSLPTGRHTLRWEGGATAAAAAVGAGAWLDRVSVVGGGYEAWAASHSLTGAAAAPDADPDGDGRKNLAEFAFRLSPNSPEIPPAGGNSGRMPAGLLVGTGSEAKLAIEFLRRQDGAVTYRVRFSDDLEQWVEGGAPVSVVDLGEGWERVTVVDVETVGVRRGRFGAVFLSLP